MRLQPVPRSLLLVCVCFRQTFSQCASTVVTQAVANLRDPAGGDVAGRIVFQQSYVGGPVSIAGSVTGLTAGLHGFHIHQTGNMTGGCTAAAGHYNPTLMNHGAPYDMIRHNGDLGNIQADSNGIANVNVNDLRVQLNGPTSVIGRAVVVHAGEDDLGKGGNTESLTTGNAGGRVACGVIGIAEEQRLCQGGFVG